MNIFSTQVVIKAYIEPINDKVYILLTQIQITKKI